MLGQRGFKQQGKGAMIKSDSWFESTKMRLVTMGSFALLLVMCFYSDTSFAADSVEATIDKVDGLVSGKLKAAGITTAVVLGGGVAVAKGHIVKAFAIAGAAIVLALVLAWAKGGMAISI